MSVGIVARRARGLYDLVLVGRIVTPFRELDGYVAVSQGRIAKVSRGTPPRARETLRAGGYVIPGFIDIHIHGAVGHDMMEGSVDALAKISEFLATKGVTGFFPTTVTAPLEDIERAVNAASELMKSGSPGAEVLGVHLEGPYFSLEKAGAQDVRYLRNPSVEEAERLLSKHPEIRRITLAPELPGAMELIKFLVERGVVVALGHTNADFDTAMEAFDLGASIVNHLFNGMAAFHHRRPGILGASLVRDDVYAEIILDSAHHHWAAREIALRCKGPERIILITDAIAATGLPDGEYSLGRLRVFVKDGVPRLEGGTLAGSSLTMDEAFRYAVRKLGVSVREASLMSSYNPARAMRVKGKGEIRMGYDADFTLLSDDLSVEATIVRGRIVYAG